MSEHPSPFRQVFEYEGLVDLPFNLNFYNETQASPLWKILLLILLQPICFSRIPFNMFEIDICNF